MELSRLGEIVGFLFDLDLSENEMAKIASNFLKTKYRVVDIHQYENSCITPKGYGVIYGHLAAGHKISAIKEYRQQTGKGLKESKDAIEALYPIFQEVFYKGLSQQNLEIARIKEVPHTLGEILDSAIK